MADCLFALGNPLLDMVVSCEPALLEKYKLQQDAAIEVENWQMSLFDDILRYDVKYTPGGSAQNTCRIAGVLLIDHPQIKITFVGCIGTDDNGKRLENMVDQYNVNTLYMRTDLHPTGVSADLISGSFRSLCANIGAAQHFHMSHLQKPELVLALTSSTIFYIEGYFLTHSYDSAMHVAQFANDNNKVLALNLSAKYICRNFGDKLRNLSSRANFIFGNREEAEEFCNEQKLSRDKDDDSVKTLAHLIWAMPNFIVDPPMSSIADPPMSSIADPPMSSIADPPMSSIADPPMSSIADAGSTGDRNVAGSFGRTTRCVIVTQGNHSVVVCNGNDLLEFPVPQIPPQKLVDTVGAGDSFVSGFLAAMMLGKNLAHCVDGGIDAAARVIQKSGCQI